jgi:hypothetical protein
MPMKEEIEKELKELQQQMALAVEEGDVTLAYELEKSIDELQNKLIRLSA